MASAIIVRRGIPKSLRWILGNGLRLLRLLNPDESFAHSSREPFPEVAAREIGERCQRWAGKIFTRRQDIGKRENTINLGIQSWLQEKEHKYKNGQTHTMARTRKVVLLSVVSLLIRVRAYQLFEARGHHPGQELDDWLQAERELKHHLNLP